MPFNYAAQRLRADRMIARYGGPAKLRRGSADRACTAVEIFYDSQEKRTTVNPVDRRVLVSAQNLSVPPDSEQDKLVMLDPVTGQDRELKIVKPVDRLAPGGVVVFWDLTVRG